MQREHPELTLPAEPIEKLAIREARRFFTFLSLHHNLFATSKLNADSLLAQALHEQMARLRNRIFKLLPLLYPPADIDAARYTLEHGDARSRSSASEYLDNILSAPAAETGAARARGHAARRARTPRQRDAQNAAARR